MPLEMTKGLDNKGPLMMIFFFPSNTYRTKGILLVHSFFAEICSKQATSQESQHLNSLTFRK